VSASAVARSLAALSLGSAPARPAGLGLGGAASGASGTTTTTTTTITAAAPPVLARANSGIARAGGGPADHKLVKKEKLKFAVKVRTGCLELAS
jgi:hypothetical protein